MSRPVALITGGTRGIGLGVARALAARGWDLALCGLRATEDVRETLDDLATSGSEVHYVRADVSSRADRDELLRSVIARFGCVDALINNAGRAPRERADLLDAKEERFTELVATNLQGPYFLTQAVARAMLDRRSAHPAARSAIVFITSVSAEMASANRGDYCVSKAGLAMAARLFAVRLASEGIAVFEVRPGIIDTDMTAPVHDLYEKRIKEGLVPAGSWGRPEDVGAVVVALLSPGSAYATGSVVHVDGGLHLPRL